MYIFCNLYLVEYTQKVYKMLKIKSNGGEMYDLFQPKTDLFSTRALILVHFKTERYFSQSIFGLFSYFKNALHHLVIELCRALFLFKIFYSYLLTSRTVL